MRKAVDGVGPSVHESAYVHPDATVIGDVTVEAVPGVWPGSRPNPLDQRNVLPAVNR